MADDGSADPGASVPYAEVEWLSPLVRRVTARNPSPLTFTGTGTYIVGRGTVAVLDPGPVEENHLAALIDAVAAERVSHVVLTHRHSDHASIARRFADQVGAPVAARPIQRPNAANSVQIAPDLVLEHGDVIDGPGWHLEAIATPGHASDHLCFAFAEEATIFSGDHVMGWNTTAIVPPDGDMMDYEASLERIRVRPELLYRPTHGPSIEDGPAWARHLLGHRQVRERSILEHLALGPADIPGLVARIYPGLDPKLVGAAGLTVLAHIMKLERLGRVVTDGPLYRLDDR